MTVRFHSDEFKWKYVHNNTEINLFVKPCIMLVIIGL